MRIGISNPTSKDEIIAASRKYRNLPKVKKGKKLELNKFSKPSSLPYMSDEDFEKLKSTKEGKDVLAYANALNDYEHEGLRINVNTISIRSDRFSVNSQIVDEDNKYVGEIERSFYPKDKVVDNAYFRLNEEARGSGFGTTFYKASEEAYKEMGYEEVAIHANISVGGYAWARMGYDFRSSRVGDGVKQIYNRAYLKRYGSLPTNEPQKPWEIAAATGPDGYRIGKEALMGSNWYAVKNLDENDEGWKVGQAYYDSKLK